MEHRVDHVSQRGRDARLDAATGALLVFAEKLTKEPGAMGPDDIDRLRDVGWDERAIHDATQVCAYFNYINRIADALGVEHEDFIDEVGRRR